MADTSAGMVASAVSAIGAAVAASTAGVVASAVPGTGDVAVTADVGPPGAGDAGLAGTTGGVSLAGPAQPGDAAAWRSLVGERLGWLCGPDAAT